MKKVTFLYSALLLSWERNSDRTLFKLCSNNYGQWQIVNMYKRKKQMSSFSLALFCMEGLEHFPLIAQCSRRILGSIWQLQRCFHLWTNWCTNKYSGKSSLRPSTCPREPMKTTTLSFSSQGIFPLWVTANRWTLYAGLSGHDSNYLTCAVPH